MYKRQILHHKSKLDCNKELQAKFKVNKRWANSIYTEVQGIISNIDENRANHIKIIQGQIKSIKSALKKCEKPIKDFAKTEQKQKSSCAKKCKRFSDKNLKIKKACHLWARERQTTQLQDAKLGLHQKKRRLNLLENQLKHLTNTKPSYTLPENSAFVLVGSKDESSGNQSAQFDYVESSDKFVLSIRTPYALEERLGEQYIRIDGLNFQHGKHELIEAISPRCYQVKTKDKTLKWEVGYSAVTLRFYRKNDCWYVAATTDITLPEITSEYLAGYVGIDLNADSVGWAVCNAQGNLLEFGDRKIDLHSRSSHQREAILSDAATFIALKAKQYNLPIASEKLDFSGKKAQLREKGNKYARMLSSFAYSQWNDALDNACQKHGIYHRKVNPAYSSLIGLTKFMSMYGMNSASAAAFVIARRGRRFSERLPQHHLLPSKSAYPTRKHVWSHWSKVAGCVKGTPRHKYFTARLNRIRKVTPFCQLACLVSQHRQKGNPIQLELFEVGATPTGIGTVSVAVPPRRRQDKRRLPTFTQICLDFN
uniref:Uncharacterized protein n=1 Tax=Tolypothrix bouteillei VB521301 TaxID=1479485 RepID=A0A0C1NFM6_9CYAN